MAFNGLAARVTGKPAGGLEALRSERAGIDAELRAIAQTLQDGDATVDALEAALTRRGALELRAKALDAKIAAEQARLAQEERERKRQEAAALKQDAEALMRKVVDALLELQPLAEQHMATVSRMQALGGPFAAADRRGETLWRTINGLLQELEPGRFYLKDQRGALADRGRK